MILAFFINIVKCEIFKKLRSICDNSIVLISQIVLIFLEFTQDLWKQHMTEITGTPYK